MAFNTNTNVVRNAKDNKHVRVTSARSFFRQPMKKMRIAPEQTDLLAKEMECCARATD